MTTKFTKPVSPVILLKKKFITIFEASIIKPQRTGLKLTSKAITIKVGKVFLALYSSILKAVAKAITTKKRIKPILAKPLVIDKPILTKGF